MLPPRGPSALSKRSNEEQQSPDLKVYEISQLYDDIKGVTHLSSIEQTNFGSMINSKD